jgi:hypothetical protein
LKSASGVCLTGYCEFSLSLSLSLFSLSFLRRIIFLFHINFNISVLKTFKIAKPAVDVPFFFSFATLSLFSSESIRNYRRSAGGEREKEKECETAQK